uniref:Histone-lysine N-methyltransferase n=1 Tax=Photinus pyralis TaxID=7054 RepID=A0A1Y1JZE7_PHOPY
MAGSEGSGQTDLLSGWSCVVHRPSEDPEPSELPSTVDMAAFSSGLSVEPTQNPNNEDSCDSDSDSDSDSNNSGSDVSGSCSQSDSSDSESSSSSPESSSRSSSPEFSVTSSQTDGLRLKIATVRKSCTSPVEKTKTFGDAKFCDKPQNVQTKVSNLSSTSDSPSSSSSESESQLNNKNNVSAVHSEKSNGEKKPSVKVQTTSVEKKTEAKPVKVNAVAVAKPAKSKIRSKRAQKVSLSHCSSSSSSDSEDCSGSDRTMLASCSLQEIRQEDLAAILPDQQECDTFGGFDCRADKNSPQTGDGSGSDMELPQQAVNALIQRTTESSSESESRVPLNPNSLYANSLLQQFVAQTQLLNVPSSTTQLNSKNNVIAPTSSQVDNTGVKTETESTKRKRGRPRKTNTNSAQNSLNTDKSQTVKSVLTAEYCANPNVSPDSGIQNCSDNVSSPESSPIPNVKSKLSHEMEQYSSKSTENDATKSKNSLMANTVKPKEQRKLPVTSNSFDRVLYGNTDRVLYPPRRKVGRPPTGTRKGPGRPPKHKVQNCSSALGTNLPSEVDISSKLSKDLAEIKIEKSKSQVNTNQGIVKKDTTDVKTKSVQKKTKAGLLHEICEKVSKRLDISIRGSQKSETKYEKVSKVSNVFKKSTNNRVVLGNKNKLETAKPKYTTLKNYKVMHSKHKGKKHKKCKFKILKPITTTLHDPKLNAEIDKLVADFVKFCNITSSKISKENVPEMLKVLKKASKKRKASDYSERKKKKQSINSTVNKEPSSNEQRLPLKKRHYHLASDVTTQPTDPDSDLKAKLMNSVKDVKVPTTSNKNVVEKVKNVSKSITPTNVVNSTKMSDECVTENNAVGCSTAKVTNSANDCVVKIPKSKAVGTHIDEAIEACITRYSSLPVEKQNLELTPPPVVKNVTESTPKLTTVDTSSTTITATTPKKRHRLQPKGCSPERVNASESLATKSDSTNDLKQEVKTKNTPLENVVSEIKVKKHLSTKFGDITYKKQEKKNELVSQVITRKKNRLEDLTMTLANKVNSSLTEGVCDGTSKRKKEIVKADECENYKRKKEVGSDTFKKEVMSDAFVDNTQKLKKATPVEVDQRTKKESINKGDCLTEVGNKRKKETIPEIVSSSQVADVDEADDSSRKSKKEVNKPEENHTDKHKKDLQAPETLSRASVIKSPISRKTKSLDHEKLDCIMTDKPTGIFMPTIDIELHIPASKIQTMRTGDKPVSEVPEKKPKIEIPCVHIENLQIKDTYKRLNESDYKRITEATEISSRKKTRKRRPINRTGFPTVKKKKKKSTPDCKVSPEVILPKPNNAEREICDRVPQEGEKYSSFLQRTEKLNVSNALLEKLQKANTTSNSNIVEQDSKKVPTSGNEKSETCQSFRLKEELLEATADGSSDVDIKTDTSDDKDCATDLDELSLEARLELMNQNSGKMNYKWGSRRGRNIFKYNKGLLHKRRLRDISPSSSVDTFIDKKLREDNFGSGDECKRSRRMPRWRKKYLPAGLFSDYFKEDDIHRQKRAEVITKSKVAYNPEEHPYGLLPPPYHCGKYLRCRKFPFQLPYDLWWQHTNSQLPGRDIVPSWNYRKIRTNVYNVKTAVGACESQSCNCTATSQCGDDCINRLVLTECPAFHKCNNQKIQKHEWAPGLEKFMTADKGWGIRTKLPIRCSEFILEYVGEVVADHEFKERMALRYAHDIHHYCLHLDGGYVIDGHRMGGDGRFVNHSCEPNCEMQKWSVNGQFRMALFALRDIEADEEITYDYNFSLFNAAEGQECKCGSSICRGVIGGKSQRVRHSISSTNSSISNDKTGRVGRPRKNQAKRSASGPRELPTAPVQTPVAPTPLMKPLSISQKTYVRDHHCFLVRNLHKGKHTRDRSLCSLPQVNSCTPGDHNPTTFMNHLNALRQPRNMRTRRLAQAEDDPKLKKMAQLASILKDFLKAITTAKDEKNELLCSSFLNLPSKRKLPEYYQRITDPIDVSTIEQNVATGVYCSVENFDADMNKVFINAVRFFGRTSEPGIAATRLKKIYFDMKQESLSKLEEIIGEKLPSNFIPSKRKNEEEDVIRCICGMYKDEGLMIQCERCLVWQHCECVQADVNAESYHCEVCVPRLVDYEIALDEFTEHGHRYYLTLLRGNLQLRQGDTVYMLRDIPIFGTDRKHTYETIGEIKYSDLDIFRIERLWKDSKTGQRFAYGHHYLRPHETFHEPTRKFFPNEVMRVPLYEAVPVELVISHCWVMDLNTYCKGRPVSAPEEHIYICEYRVDKSARLFSKISKAKYPICTKTYAFERFDVKLKISRTYTPHDLDPAFVKPRGRKPVESDEARELQKLPVHVPVLRTPLEKKVRLNKLLLALLSKMPTKQALDVSYLLEGGRRRKKQLDK